MSALTSSTVKRRITVAVWILGTLLATVLISRRPSTQIRGLAWAEPVVLAAPADGTLADFELTLHEMVAPGDLIARFDPEALAARHHVLLAELQALTEAERIDRESRTRVFERDREAARLEFGALTSSVLEGQARIEALHGELAVAERLLSEGLVPREQALAVRREINVIDTRLAADRERLELARRSAQRASSRAATAPGTNRWQIEAARRELDELEEHIQQLSLRSSISGQIMEIYRRPGEYLRAGEPVLRISPVGATEVHAWLDVRPPPDLGRKLSAEVRTGGGEKFFAKIRSVGAERLQMPASLWARADIPEWGYLIRVDAADGQFSPGEPVRVGLRSPP